MQKKIMSLAIFCLISLSNNAIAQTTQVKTSDAPTVPTEVGTTTMPPGNYLVIDQSTGSKYSLMVTTKGTMIFGPASAASAGAAPAASSLSSKAASGVKGLAEKQAEKYVQNKGMSEIQNFIK